MLYSANLGGNHPVKGEPWTYFREILFCYARFNMSFPLMWLVLGEFFEVAYTSYVQPLHILSRTYFFIFSLKGLPQLVSIFMNIFLDAFQFSSVPFFFVGCLSTIPLFTCMSLDSTYFNSAEGFTILQSVTVPGRGYFYAAVYKYMGIARFSFNQKVDYPISSLVFYQFLLWGKFIGSFLEGILSPLRVKNMPLYLLVPFFFDFLSILLFIKFIVRSRNSGVYLGPPADLRSSIASVLLYVPLSLSIFLILNFCQKYNTYSFSAGLLVILPFIFFRETPRRARLICFIFITESFFGVGRGLFYVLPRIYFRSLRGGDSTFEGVYTSFVQLAGATIAPILASRLLYRLKPVGRILIYLGMTAGFCFALSVSFSYSLTVGGLLLLILIYHFELMGIGATQDIVVESLRDSGDQYQNSVYLSTLYCVVSMMMLSTSDVIDKVNFLGFSSFSNLMGGIYFGLFTFLLATFLLFSEEGIQGLIYPEASREPVKL